MRFLDLFRSSTKPKIKVNLEEDAFRVIVEMLTLAKEGKPYRHLMPVIKERYNQFPRVAALINSLHEYLNKGKKK